MDKKLIIVTGYGVFANHEEKNASWEAVKQLPDRIALDEEYKIEKILVEVEYEDVDKKVEEVWRKKPYLVIHVGVHGNVLNIILEKCAINGFCKQDYACKTLQDPVICLENSGKCRRLETLLDVDKIVPLLNETCENINFEGSCDVGSYLCGYIYLKSLDKDPSRTLFVHVPPINKPYSSEDTTKGLLKIVEQCIYDLGRRSRK